MTLRLRLATLFVLALAASLCTGQPLQLSDRSADYKKLTAGITTLPRIGGTNGIILTGPFSFGIAVGAATGHFVPGIAAATNGNGVGLLFGNQHYLSKNGLADKNIARLIDNTIKFGLKQQRSPRVAVYGTEGLEQALTAKGYLVKRFTRPGYGKDLEHYDAFVSDTMYHGNGDDLRRLRAFILGGGAYIAGYDATAYQQRYPNLIAGQNLHANAVMRGYGLTIGQQRVNNFRPLKYEDTQLTHTQAALRRLIDHRDNRKKLNATELRWDSALIVNAIDSLSPSDGLFINRLDNELEYVISSLNPTERRPVKLTDAFKRLAIYKVAKDNRGVTPASLTANQSARDFPGLAPRRATRISRDFNITGDSTGWISTGLYANAGDRIEIKTFTKDIKKGLRIRIGAHTDVLWNVNDWKRHPQITTEYALDKPSLDLRSEFGGPIYIVVPSSGLKEKAVVRVDGGIPSPHFILGKTNLEDWKVEVRQRPGPWAELVGKNVALTVPSDSIRELDDPQALLIFWDLVAETCARLSMRPLTKRKHRIVVDVQLAYGTIHGGYPTMAQKNYVDNVLTVNSKDLQGQLNNPYLWQEFGRNFLHPDWTFTGSNTVQANIFRLYILEHGFDLNTDVAAQYDIKKIKAFLADSPNYDKWRTNPSIAIQMYAQLIRNFGWEVFTKTFATYRDLSPAERPKNDQQKRDLWFTTLSQSSGKNLTKFFTAWGLPPSREASAQVASLPDWMPADLQN